jgi:hypothetical protein
MLPATFLTPAALGGIGPWKEENCAQNLVSRSNLCNQWILKSDRMGMAGQVLDTLFLIESPFRYSWLPDFQIH